MVVSDPLTAVLCLMFVYIVFMCAFIDLRALHMSCSILPPFTHPLTPSKNPHPPPKKKTPTHPHA